MKANHSNKRRLPLLAHRLVAVITLIFFSAANVFALPAGQQVLNGQAGFLTQGNNLTITNSLGMKVYAEKEVAINGKTVKNLSLSGLSSGIYMLALQNGDMKITQKLLIK